MAPTTNSRPFQRWVTLAFLVLALGLVVRSIALFLANGLPLKLVLGARYLPLACALLGSLTVVLIAGGHEWRVRDSAKHNALGAARWAFTAAVASSITFLAFVDPFQRLWFDLALGLGAGALALSVLGMRFLSARNARAALLVDLVTFSLCAGLLGLELGLRTWAAAFPSPMLARVGGGPSELVQRFRCEPGEVRFGFACNSAGYYDEEFYRKQPGEAQRVVAIGDSFGVGTVPHAWHYTTIVEELGGLQVDNMGVAGIGPREYLSLLVEEALPLDPDLLLITVFVGNDLSVEDVLSDLPDRELRAWLQRDQVLLAVLPQRIARLREEEGRLAGRGQARGGQGETVRRAMTREAAGAAFPWVLDPLLEEPSLAPETFRNIEIGRALDVCAQDPPSLELLKTCLIEAKRAAGDIPLAVMLIPDEFQVEDELWEVVRQAAGRPLERDRPQRLLMRWFQSSGIPALDLLPILRDVPPLADGRRHLYHALDTHFNARGNEQTAKALNVFLGDLPRRGR